MSRISRFTWLFLTIFNFFYINHIAAQGIQFRHFEWEDALTQAKTENKVIFVDAIASWCGPCRIMSKEVFPDSALGEFFNRHFINLKMDMEKAEGIKVSNLYKVWAYPTLLFVDGSGKELHRSVGYLSALEMLALGRTALDPTSNLAGMEIQYAAGKRNRDFMLQFLKAKTAAYDPNAGDLANDFLKTEESLDTPENMELILQHVTDPYSRGFRYLLMNRNDFEEKYGKREVKVKILSVFEGYLQAHPELQLGEVQRLYGTVYPEKGEELASRYKVDYYLKQRNMEQFALSALEHFKRFPSEDPDELNEMAWLFSEEVRNPEYLETALGWVQNAIFIHETTYYQYTLAKLWPKLGKKKAAKKAAERALELAKATEEDSFLIAELLEEIQKK